MAHQKYVLFAGEHTDSEDFGTVKAGYASGLRASCVIDKKACSTSKAPTHKVFICSLFFAVIGIKKLVI